MSTVKKVDGDEILYLNEIHDKVSRTLTSNDVGAVPAIHSIPSIGLRAGFSTEADEDKSVSKSKIDDGNDENLNGQPLSAIGFNKDRSLAETKSHPDWPNNVFLLAPSTVQLATPDVNIYLHNKTLAQGMMDVALLSANVNQMRYVLQTDGRHPYFYPSLIMISMSLFLQIAVGIGLIWDVYTVKKHEQMCKANKANNWSVIGIFLVTILNVFILIFV
ncbi:hypothetical protein DMN91_011481 [Ooceraea biroi]|uniref:Ninjurin-1 n=1 Tax=Ooceraea biroi TaxID=2015173 RepID=A0A026VY44_OOCBI|nr:Ninjurin-1 [Ooceraea biroi]RLU15726.1 hypothetical protein DMN91_011481 [Ooceraea biroi]